jgi:competence protein ComEC
VKRFPALKVAISAAVGIFIGKEFPHYQLLFLSVGLCLVMMMSVWLILRRERISTLISVGFYAALVCAFAFSMSTNIASLSSTPLSNYVCFAGRIEESPRDSAISSVILGECSGFDKSWYKIAGELIVTPKFKAQFRTGDRLIFTGKAGAISEARNPGEFDLKSYYLLSGIVGRIYLTNEKDVLSVYHDSGFSPQRSIVEPVRNFMRNEIKTFMKGDEAELARAMVIGERIGINKEVSEQFINTGTIHILAVSGLHIGFFMGILMAVASILRIPRKFRFFIIAPILILYALVVGMTPSITRAVIMALVVLFGFFLQRKSQILNSLGFAALIILTFNPSQLFTAGFQLSFAAVLSIALLHERIVGMVRISYPALQEKPLLNSALSIAFLTIAATLGTIPLTVYYFHRVSLVSVLANFIVVPLAGIFLSMVFLFLFFGLFSTFLASLYASAAQIIGFAILQINFLLGSMKISHVVVPDVGWSFALLYFFWLFASVTFPWTNSSGDKNVLMKKVIFSVLLGLNIILYVNLFEEKTEVRLFVLDVGQGDAIFVELPGGKNMLIDAGIKFRSYDMGERVVVPFLERNGIGEINYFVVTHLHIDHMGGAASVIRNVKVDNFIYPEQSSQSETWIKTMACVAAFKIPSRNVRAGMILDSGSVYRVYVIHPNRKYVGEGGLAYNKRFNNGSVVLKVCIGKESILLAGDAEKPVEHDLIKIYGTFLASDIYKAGHHGSNTSSTPEFLKTIHPTYAVISVGAKNRFGHPSPEVIAELRRENIKIWRTDSLGAAFFRVNADTFKLVQWK